MGGYKILLSFFFPSTCWMIISCLWTWYDNRNGITFKRLQTCIVILFGYLGFCWSFFLSLFFKWLSLNVGIEFGMEWSCLVVDMKSMFFSCGNHSGSGSKNSLSQTRSRTSNSIPPTLTPWVKPAFMWLLCHSKGKLWWCLPILGVMFSSSLYPCPSPVIAGWSLLNTMIAL